MAGQALLELVLVFDLMGNCMLRLMSPVWPSCIRLCGILRAIVIVHCVIAVCQSVYVAVVRLMADVAQRVGMSQHGRCAGPV